MKNKDLLLLFFFFSGFNFFGGKIFILLGLPSYTMDILAMIVLLIMLFRGLTIKLKYHSILHFYMIFFVISLVFLFGKLLVQNSNLISGISSLYRVFFIQIILIISANLRYNETQKIIKVITVFSLFFFSIGLIQFLFWEHLPRYLLTSTLDNNHIDGIMFGLIKGVRANGIFGNPIELSVLGVLIVYINKKRLSTFKYLVIMPGVLVTLSRAGLIGLIILFFRSLKLKIIIPVLLLFSIFIYKIGNLGLFSRLFFLTNESSESTASRLVYFQETFTMGSSNLLLGFPLGSTSSRGLSEVSVQVYDGYLLNIITEYGLIYFVVWFLIFSLLMIRALKKDYEGKIILIFLMLTGSAFLHPMLGGLIYFILGMKLKNNQNENRNLYSLV